jgi:hypothetical protein
MMRSPALLLAAVGASAAVAAVFAVAAPACDSPAMSLPDFSNPFDLKPPAAEVLAPAQTLTSCISVDDTRVYWTDDGDGGSVKSVAKTGGAVTTLVSGMGTVDRRSCIVTDATHAYFTRDGASTIQRVAKAGASAVETIASGQNVLGGALAIPNPPDGYVYWVTDVYGAVDAYNGKNAVVRAPVAGGSAPPSVEYDSVTGDASGIVVTASTFYLSDESGVYSLARGPRTRVDFGMSLFRPTTFAVDATHIVLVEATGIGQGAVVLFKLDGTGRVKLSDEPAATLAIDSSGVYAKKDNRLIRMKLDGSKVEALSSDTARAIAIDATHIYFTDGAQILRIAK